MGRKKASGGATQVVQRPFCFFCDRQFDDETVLLQHQRAKHFRCPECDDGAVRGKCESVQGLIVHTLKVHGKALARVPNALQGRDNPDLNVYGMDGIPSEMLQDRGYSVARFSGDQPPEPKPALAPAAVPMMPPMAPGMCGLPSGMLTLPPPPGMACLPGMPMMALPGADVAGMPGMMPNFPGAPDLPVMGSTFSAGTNPSNMCNLSAPSATGPGGMPPISPGAVPSIEGFQQFLAQQGSPRPALPVGDGMPGPAQQQQQQQQPQPPPQQQPQQSPQQQPQQQQQVPLPSPPRGFSDGTPQAQPRRHSEGGSSLQGFSNGPPPQQPPQMPQKPRGFSDGPPQQVQVPRGFSDAPPQMPRGFSGGPPPDIIPRGLSDGAITQQMPRGFSDGPMQQQQQRTPRGFSDPTPTGVTDDGTSKRRRMEDEEDVSVEELRAQLARYRGPR